MEASTGRNYSITDEKICLCALNRIFGFEPAVARTLMGGFPKLTELFTLNDSQKRDLFGPYSRHSALLTTNALEKEAAELRSISEEGVWFFGLAEEGYPQRLMECEDAPAGIYVKCGGDAAKVLNPEHAVAIVGTRAMTDYGREWCENIVSALASTKEKPTIISGLAYGTDYTAHRTALALGLPTIGIMATGPEEIYPARHRRIAGTMASQDGCGLLTDYPPGTAPMAVNFIRRNRIIAGMSDAVILTESAVKGGGMITARQAFSYDRDVFAIPGRCSDTLSQGCNMLIRENIAQIADSTEGLVKALKFNGNGGTRKHFTPDSIISSTYNGSSDKYCKTMSDILRAIHDNPGVQVEQLAVQLNREYHKIAELVCRLECDGLVTTDIAGCCRIDRIKCSS